MKLTATIIRSVEADMQAELRHVERAVASGTREAGRGLLGERFFQEFTLSQVLLNAAKNGSGPSAAGISSRAEGPSIAEPAATTDCPAPEASLEPMGSSAPSASTP